MPDGDEHKESNADPLVIGTHMFFDYCKKARRAPHEEARINLAPQNGLGRGDVVLFVAMKEEAVFVDTVFVVGDRRAWPEAGIPWTRREAGTIACRVHFHHFAHCVQHPEVHEPGKVVASSYRGRQYDRGDGTEVKNDLYCWVPFRRDLNHGSPMVLKQESRAFPLLEEIYGKGALNAPRRGFGVHSIDQVKARALFVALQEDAVQVGCGVAVEEALLSNAVRAVKSGRDVPPGCSARERADPGERTLIRRAGRIC